MNALLAVRQLATVRQLESMKVRLIVQSSWRLSSRQMGAALLKLDMAILDLGGTPVPVTETRYRALLEWIGN